MIVERRRGFSLLEAIVVLGITSLTLLLIFDVASHSTRQGFRLGRRALGAADAQVGYQSARAVLRGLVVPVFHAGGAPTPDLDGSPSSLTALADLDRPTPCAGSGPAGLIRLSFDHTAEGWRLVCQTQAAGAAALMNLGPLQPSFSYALDGRPWSGQVHVSGLSQPGALPPQEHRLLVRLVTADARVDMTEAVSTGQPPAGQGGVR